jgi:site-specific DNA recombinase
MHAVLYCRVSTVEQVQNLSLSTQEKACRDYAEREGYAVAEVFVDRGESAKTTDRPEFQRLLTYCRQHAGKVHAVIVYGLSRFSRNSADHHAIAALLRGRGIALRSVTEPIDDSPAGRFMEGICAAMAQFDNDLKSDRTKAGMRAAAERGRWVWRAPAGYRNGAKALGEPSLVPDGAKADAIRQAFQDIASTDRGVIDVWRAAVRSGLAGLSGATSLQTMHRILRSPVYVGRLTSRGLGADGRGDWVPLVDEPTWLHVQARLRLAELPAKRRQHPDFPLRRFVHCGTCGEPLTGGWSTGRSARYAYYNCRRHCVQTTKRVLEEALLEFLSAMSPDPEFLDLLHRIVLDGYRQERQRAMEHRDGLAARVTQIESQIRRLDEAFLFEKVIDRDTYAERRDEARDRLTLARMELSQATIDDVDVEGALAGATYAIRNAAALWTGATNPEQRERLQWALFPDGLTWSGSVLSNRGSRWACYQLQANAGAGAKMASHILPSSNQIAEWSTAWRGYLAAA